MKLTLSKIDYNKIELIMYTNVIIYIITHNTTDILNS